MNVELQKVTINNLDDADRKYDVKATFGKETATGAAEAKETVETGEVFDKETHTTLATFASYGADQLSPMFYVANGRSAILEAIEDFIGDGFTFIATMQ